MSVIIKPLKKPLKLLKLVVDQSYLIPILSHIRSQLLDTQLSTLFSYLCLMVSIQVELLWKKSTYSFNKI